MQGRSKHRTPQDVQKIIKGLKQEENFKHELN
jgi:hypothetical protein